MISADLVDILTVMVGAVVFGGLLAAGVWLASVATPSAPQPRRSSAMWWVQKPPKPVNHVYVLRDPSMPWSPVKVGLSVDPERRAESISRETGKPLQVHYVAQGASFRMR